ncbi:hypothetical protein CDEST_02939 [Colletotrichum destructivum]|uniref:Uncharacterized protein n=1 Tax=Colletotrichum destructivum TaxID=34406 RepID=A0AAX4I4K4_9PEZI|nr:hypothetical protein CDEST_02939 [Colletotrichum destructivum]
MRSETLWSNRIPLDAVEWSQSLRQEGARGLSKTLRHVGEEGKTCFGPIDSCHGSSCLGDAPNTAWNGHGIWRRSSGSMLFRFPAERHTANAWSGLPFTASIGYI